MNDSEILTAALRWHTLHKSRLAVGADSNRFKREQKQRTGFGGSDYVLSARVTEAKRLELAALRQLAKACAKSLEVYTVDVAATAVVDVPVLLTCE